MAAQKAEFPVFPLKGVQRLSPRSAFDSTGDSPLYGDDIVVDRRGTIWSRPGYTAFSDFSPDVGSIDWINAFVLQIPPSGSIIYDGSLWGIQRNRILQVLSLLNGTSQSYNLATQFSSSVSGQYFGMDCFPLAGVSTVYIGSGSDDVLVSTNTNPATGALTSAVVTTLPSGFGPQLLMTFGQTLFGARNAAAPYQIVMSNGNTPSNSANWTTDNLIQYPYLGSVTAMIPLGSVAAFIHGAYDIIRVTGPGPNLQHYTFTPMYVGRGSIGPDVVYYQGYQYFVGVDGFYAFDGQSVPINLAKGIAPFLRGVTQFQDMLKQGGGVYNRTRDFPHVFIMDAMANGAINFETGMEGCTFIAFMIDANNDGKNDTIWAFNVDNQTWTRWTNQNFVTAVRAPNWIAQGGGAPWYTFDANATGTVYKGAIGPSDNGTQITGVWSGPFCHANAPFIVKLLDHFVISGVPQSAILSQGNSPGLTVKAAFDGIESWNILPKGHPTRIPHRAFFKAPRQNPCVTFSLRVEMARANTPMFNGYQAVYEAEHPRKALPAQSGGA